MLYHISCHNIADKSKLQCIYITYSIGSDPKWTAIHKDDYTNFALHYYNSSLVNTNDGYLNITTIIQDVTFKYDDVKVIVIYIYIYMRHKSYVVSRDVIQHIKLYALYLYMCAIMMTSRE